MIKIYEAHSGASSDLRTHLGCISAWSNQGLVAYICERTIEAKLLSVRGSDFKSSSIIAYNLYGAELNLVAFAYKYRVGDRLVRKCYCLRSMAVFTGVIK